MRTTNSLRWPVLFPLLALLLPTAAWAQAPAASDPGQPAATSPAPAPTATGGAPAPTGAVVADAPPAPPPPTVATVQNPIAIGDERASLELGGFVAAQVTFDSNDAVRQNQLISVDGQGQTGRFGWAFDATRLNLVGKVGVGGFKLLGRAEVDMQSPIYFRIRHVYASASRGGTRLLIGQTDTLVGNWVGPNNFNNDWMFTQGNAYDRLPQLQVSHDTGHFLAALAVLPNLHGASDVIPHVQARVMLHGARGLVGLSGHFGYSNRVKNPANPTSEVDGVLSYLAAIDGGLSLGALSLSLQLWYGAGAAHGTSGHAIGNPLFVVGVGGDPTPVPSVGGFADVMLKLGSRLALGAAGGASVLTNNSPGGIPVPIANNSTVVLYASFALRQHWIFALEAQGARTERTLTAALPTSYSAVYDGRLLFGQKYAF